MQTFKRNGEKNLNCEIFNESMIIEVDDDQSQRENVMRPILSNNIKFVSVCDHINPSTKEYGIKIRTRDLGMNMGRIRDRCSN